jgi:hypothetical protein
MLNFQICSSSLCSKLSGILRISAASHVLNNCCIRVVNELLHFHIFSSVDHRCSNVSLIFIPEPRVFPHTNFLTVSQFPSKATSNYHLGRVDTTPYITWVMPQLCLKKSLLMIIFSLEDS